MYAFDHLTFRFRDFVFRDFSGLIPEGKVGITGPNGAGKTTLLRLLDRQLQPDSGSVDLAGRTYFVEFDLTRFHSFLWSDLVDLAGRLRSFDVSGAHDRAAELGLSPYLKVPIGELSKGTAKKVSLLLGFCSTAETLLIDEPFEAVDEQSNEAIIEAIRVMNRDAVVVSHDHHDLRRSVDAIYRVEDCGLAPEPC